LLGPLRVIAQVTHMLSLLRARQIIPEHKNKQTYTNMMIGKD